MHVHTVQLLVNSNVCKVLLTFHMSIAMQALQPTEQDAGELRDHVIIAGFGRVGQIIAQLLSERLIPYVALDVSAERVQVAALADGMPGMV
jgi:threonine dehydrogenase-like Zn-dependent dehydrogenase